MSAGIGGKFSAHWRSKPVGFEEVPEEEHLAMRRLRTKSFDLLLQLCQLRRCIWCRKSNLALENNQRAFSCGDLFFVHSSLHELFRWFFGSKNPRFCPHAHHSSLGSANVEGILESLRMRTLLHQGIRNRLLWCVAGFVRWHKCNSATSRQQHPTHPTDVTRVWPMRFKREATEPCQSART